MGCKLPENRAENLFPKEYSVLIFLFFNYFFLPKTIPTGILKIKIGMFA
jgi:hypothetical protein